VLITFKGEVDDKIKTREDVGVNLKLSALVCCCEPALTISLMYQQKQSLSPLRDIE